MKASRSPNSVPFHQSGNLDFLRSLAVLSVVVYHLLIVFRCISDLVIWPLGRFGVLLFFVHTSLVLMMSLERSELDRERLFAPFYIRRLCRIYPLSLACIFAVLALRIPAVPWSRFYSPSLHDLAANAALVHNFVKAQMIIGPLWSLPYEVQMYFFLPFIYLLFRKATSPKPALLLWLSAYLIGILLYGSANLIDHFVPCFLAGCLSYQLSKNARPRLPGWLWPPAVLIMGIAFIGISNSPITVTNFDTFVIQPILCLVVGALIPQFQEIRSAWLKRASKQIAKYSYGIYLTHAPLLIYFFVMHQKSSKAFTVPAFLLCFVGLPFAAFWLIEDPMIRIGRRLARFRSGNSVVTPVPIVADAQATVSDLPSSAVRP